MIPETNLYRLTVAFRNGDDAAGWAVAMSRQMQALIEKQARMVGRYRYVDSHHVEDIRTDLMMRIMQRLKEFTLPDHGEDVANEKAIVAYFKLAIRDLTTRSVRLIVGPNALKTGDAADVHVTMSQVNGPQNLGCGISGDYFDSHTLDPQSALFRNERALVMALCRRFFDNDEEAIQGFTAMQANSMGNDSWGDIAEAIGLSREKYKRAQYLASRYRNIMRAAMLESGHDCEFTVVGIYTDDTEGAITTLKRNGVIDTKVTPVRSSFASEAFASRIRESLAEHDVTFAVLNHSDRSSILRSAALMALHNREPLVTFTDAEAIDAELQNHEPNIRTRELSRMNPGRRRSILLARAWQAKYLLLSEAA